MPPTFEPLNLPFSTADAELPSITFDRGEIRVCFIDWREQEVWLLFRDVVGFSWDEGDAALCEDHRDDLCYFVRDSKWLSRHVAVGTINSVEKYYHYKLCFNSKGVLQVLASSLVNLSERADLGSE